VYVSISYSFAWESRHFESMLNCGFVAGVVSGIIHPDKLKETLDPGFLKIEVKRFSSLIYLT